MGLLPRSLYYHDPQIATSSEISSELQTTMIVADGHVSPVSSSEGSTRENEKAILNEIEECLELDRRDWCWSTLGRAGDEAYSHV